MSLDNGMILRIDPELPTPVYRQIVDGLRIALVNGDLAPDQELPAVRRLAMDLGVHFNTVAQAYRELAQEGWLELRARSGARVKQRAEPPAADTRLDAIFARRVEELAAEAQAHGVPAARLAQQLRHILLKLEGK